VSSLDRLAVAPRPDAGAGRAPRRYGEDCVHLLVRDPRRVFAAWEISPALAAVASARAEEERASARYQIRIERSDGGETPALPVVTVDLPNALDNGGWYIDLPASGGQARAVLGLDLPSGFCPLLFSRWASVPPEGPCVETATWEPNGAARSAGRGRSGYLSILLHAHLPFVRHPEYEDALEERWLDEALLECYLPLLRMLEGRAARRAPGRITISLSPTLLAMLEDPLLRGRFAKRLERLITLAERDVARYRDDSRYGPLARHYAERFHAARAQYEGRYRRDVARAFRDVEASGVARLITCGATHGFLPLMDLRVPSWRGQIGVAVREFERQIGHRPEGIWLPECGYAPGVESVLAEFGIRYFAVDAHAIEHARPRPAAGTYAPLRVEGGVFALGRDAESSRQVWSSTEGYPGDPSYREYYRDQGFDLPLEEVREFLPSGGTRTHLGLKYHRITDRRFPHREPYDPAAARERVVAHAAHFVRGREDQARGAAGSIGQPALMLAPYDAELFGHWWYEGPEWLDRVLDGASSSDLVEATDPLDAIERLPRIQPAGVHLSSWGEGGYCAVWLDPVNDWIYRPLLRAAETMRALAQEGDGGSPGRARALRQAGRELLLAQASDWAFIMKTGTLVPYARRRTEEHLDRFEKLAEALRRGAVDLAELAAMEARYGPFPDLDPGLFA
jgi:1,4-alpha-glucan branching enzyme